MAPEKISSAKATKPAKDKSEKKSKSKTKEDKKRKRDHMDDSERRKSKKSRKSHGDDAITTKAVASAPILPFHTQTSSLYLPLSPISQKQPLEGICAEHLSPLILTYYPPFNGVILSYSSPRLSERPFCSDGPETLLHCIDEFGVSYTWVTAEFLVFKPQRGGELEGYINLQNEGHLGLVCWNLFNASIEQKRLPKDWKWIGPVNAEETDEYGNYAEDGVGHFVNGNGEKIEGIIKFRVKDIESSADRERGFLSIEGTMLEESDEKELLEEEISSSQKHVLGSGKRLGGSRALGATSLGVPAEPDPDAEFGGGMKKHRTRYQ